MFMLYKRTRGTSIKSKYKPNRKDNSFYPISGTIGAYTNGCVYIRLVEKTKENV